MFGAVAKNQQEMNLENTIYEFKHLIGKLFKDDFVSNEQKKLNYKIIEFETGEIGIKTNYQLEQQTMEYYFHPEQVLAMLLSEIVGQSEYKNPKVVLTVPSYFTSSERQAMLLAAKIANIDCVKLLNETTAIALNYGYYKQDDFDINKPTNVAFIDFGHSSLQVSIVAFTKGNLNVLANTSVMIGGRDFDEKLADHFWNEANVGQRENNIRSYSRLMIEVQKLKKMMSTNTTNLKLKIENFKNLETFESTIRREMMDNICEELLVKLSQTIKSCITVSQLKINDIFSVEITGGSSRIPAFKRIVENIFKKPPSTTMNQDEAISKGGAIFCAMKLNQGELQHTIEIKDFLTHHPLQVELRSKDGTKIASEPYFNNNKTFPIHNKVVFKLRRKKMPFKVLFSSFDRPISLDKWLRKFYCFF